MQCAQLTPHLPFSGAVIEKGSEPMLIMEYMHHGSLYDILHNETMVIEGEILIPILRDISQGVRFLHSAEPKVVHGGTFNKHPRLFVSFFY